MTTEAQPERRGEKRILSGLGFSITVLFAFVSAGQHLIGRSTPTRTSTRGSSTTTEHAIRWMRRSEGCSGGVAGGADRGRLRRLRS